MFVDIVKSKVDDVELTAKDWEKYVGEILKRQPGFVAAYMMGDASQSGLLGVGIWETEEHLKAWEACEAKKQAGANIKAHFQGPPEVRHMKLMTKVTKD